MRRTWSCGVYFCKSAKNASKIAQAERPGVDALKTGALAVAAGEECPELEQPASATDATPSKQAIQRWMHTMATGHRPEWTLRNTSIT